MGLLVNWGIRKLENAERDIQSISDKLGFKPLSWRDIVSMDKTRDGVMWRIPDPHVPPASSLFSVQAIFVMENELVMVMQDGRLDDGLLLPGLYDIKQLTALRGQLGVVWFTTREFQLRWGIGIGDVFTKDRISVGAYGTYQINVVNPELFYHSAAGNWQVYTEEQLSELTKPPIISAISGMIRYWDVLELQSAQSEIQHACKEALMPSFQRWGLEFCGLTMRLTIPEAFRQAVQQQTIVRLEKEAQIEGAKGDVTITGYTTLAEVERLRALENARVEIMRNQLNAGINPLELQKIEVLKLLAEHPAEGPLVDARPQIVGQLLSQSPVPQSPVPQFPLMPPTESVFVTIDPPVAPTPQLNAPASLPENASSKTASSTGETIAREKIMQVLDDLFDLYINGKLTEQEYSERCTLLKNRL